MEELFRLEEIEEAWQLDGACALGLNPDLGKILFLGGGKKVT